MTADLETALREVEEAEGSERTTWVKFALSRKRLSIGKGFSYDTLYEGTKLRWAMSKGGSEVNETLRTYACEDRDECGFILWKEAGALH